MRKKLFLKNTISIILLLFFATSALSVELQQSITTIPSSNGLCLLSYNVKKRVVDTFLPHIMDVWDVGKPTENLIQSASYKLNIKGEVIDLSFIPVTHVGYENGTGIIRTEQDASPLKILSYIWSPMILDHKVIFLVIHIPNAADYNLSQDNVSLFLETASPNIDNIRCIQKDGKDLWVCHSLIYNAGLEPETLARLQKELSRAKPKLLLDAEKRWWMHWHRLGRIPSRIYDVKYQVLLQSAAFLKMSQCREAGKSKGQIVDNLSVLFPSAAYPRDMAYSIVALSKLGYYTEAKAALDFMLNSNAGQFKSHKVSGQEWGMGQDYKISLSHYTGMGYERTNSRTGNPLFYFDGQGLFLWAASEYIKASADFEFANRNWKTIQEHIVQPLVQSIDKTGLLRRDSGWWDTPAPGLHFGFTSLSACNGLLSATVISHSGGHEQDVSFYTKKAAALRETILTKLTVGRSKVLSRCLETKSFPYFLDGSAVEAINWQIIKPEWKTSESTLQALESFLRVGERPRGFSLAFKGKQVKGDEDLFVSLRSVEAFQRKGHKKRALELLDWITKQSSRNAEMIPQSFSADKAYYKGPYPVIGMGSGAYILAVLALYDQI